MEGLAFARVLLRANGLRKCYGSVRAVDGVSLEVAPGEVVGLLGPNGAGKSTTLGICTGLVHADEGRVTLGDAGSPESPLARRNFGLAPQQLALYEQLSARENLEFLGEVYCVREPGKRADELLALVELGPRARDRVRTYSGGMKRRLNFVAALVHDPQLVLLDEPTAGVDPQSRGAILDLAVRLAAEGRAVVYTTHYLEEAERICSRVVIVDNGLVIARGTVPELLSPGHASLEDAFLALTGKRVRD